MMAWIESERRQNVCKNRKRTGKSPSRGDHEGLKREGQVSKRRIPPACPIHADNANRKAHNAAPDRILHCRSDIITDQYLLRPLLHVNPLVGSESTCSALPLVFW